MSRSTWRSNKSCISCGGRLEGAVRVGSLVNAGVVAPGSGIGSLTVAGDYTGNGGVLEIEAALGGDASAADRLVVNGATSGNTRVMVINRGVVGDQTVAVAFTADDGELLDTICAANDVPTGLVMKLLDIERASHGLKRRHAVHTRIEDAFRSEWRELDTIVAERRQKLGISSDGLAEMEPDESELPYDGEGDEA
jgi:hypothetical protein